MDAKRTIAITSETWQKMVRIKRERGITFLYQVGKAIDLLERSLK